MEKTLIPETIAIRIRIIHMEQETVTFQCIDFKVDFYRTYERSDPDTGFVGGWRVDVRRVVHVPNPEFNELEQAAELAELAELKSKINLIPAMEQHLEDIFNDPK